MLKLSRGRICVANFIPPVNDASLVSYFWFKNLTSAYKHCLNKPTSPFFETIMVNRADKYRMKHLQISKFYH